MSEARIDRLLAASLHQAIADLLPMRLEFYESYLRPRGWREDAVNLAPVAAVLSFLRREDEDTYDAVMGKAAAYASEWWMLAQPWHVRSAGRMLPVRMRLRQLATLARRHFETSYRGTKVRTRVRRRQIEIEIRGSIFCNARDHAQHPQCRYYLAFVNALLVREGMRGEGQIVACRAVDGDTCLLRIDVQEDGA